MTDPEALAAVRDVAGEAFGREPDWAALAQAGLLALSVPGAHGGEGLGLAAAAEVIRAAGAAASDLPLVDHAATVATLAAAGTDAQQKQWLPGLADGSVRAAVALREPGSAAPSRPATTYDAAGRLHGRKVGVRAGRDSGLVLVSARAGDAHVVALLDPAAPGARWEASPTSSGAPEATLVLEGAPAELLEGADAARLLEHATTAALVTRAAGLLAGARDLTAGYVKERTQFGRALAEFQAVAQQMADVYVASRTLDLAAGAAVARAGDPHATDVAVAAHWACVEAPAALHTCHHLHGGMGLDETYPLHHYYSQVADVAHALGGAAATLARVRPEDPAAKNPELSTEQRRLKSEIRAYFAGLITPAEHREMAHDRHGETYQRTIRRMGADGWMGVGWPAAYGGQGFGEVEQTIFANEASYADVHLPSVTLQTVGPTLMRFGTEEQKERFLGPILRGEVHFAIGYSEPDAGTDLASLRTSARLITNDGEPYYLVNGQKMWTTGGHEADFIWLAARTDPDAPKHRGITILIVDTNDPGYSWTPIITADGSHHVNATYFHDVRVPVDMVVGEVDQGWRLITTQLNHERVMLGPAGRIEGLRDRVAAWAQAHGVAEEPDVRAALAEATAAFRINELLNWEVAGSAAAGEISVADASSSKVFAADRVQSLGRRLAEVVHRYADPAEPATAELIGFLDGQAKRNLVLTFGGGVTEVQKELIAMFGLGLPRVPR